MNAWNGLLSFTIIKKNYRFESEANEERLLLSKDDIYCESQIKNVKLFTENLKNMINPNKCHFEGLVIFES